MLLANNKAGAAQKEKALFQLGKKLRINEEAVKKEPVLINQYSAKKLPPTAKPVEETKTAVMQLKEQNL